MLSAVCTLVTVLLIYHQLAALRRDIRARNMTDLASKWNLVSAQEIRNPTLHKMLLGPRARAATVGLSDSELEKRAFAHFVFDVLTEQHRLKRDADITIGTEEYLKLVLSNSEMRKMWADYEIREVWQGDPFGECIDSLCELAEKKEADTYPG